MSHYSAVAIKGFKDKELLITALSRMDSGYGNWQTESHNTPDNLIGYKGDRREQIANIIVRRNHLSRYSNDLGFIWDNATQTYQMIISEYDEKILGENFKRNLSTEYVVALAERQGLKVVSRHIVDGKVRLTTEGQVKSATATIRR